MALLCTVSFFVNFIQAEPNAAYVESLEKALGAALVEKSTHGGGAGAGVSAGVVQTPQSDLGKIDANMVGSGVVTAIAQMKESMLDWLSTSELTSKQEAGRRLQAAQAAANNCFATCSGMLRSVGGNMVVGAVYRPMNTPGMMPSVSPAGMQGSLPGIMPVQRPGAMGMSGVPMGTQPVQQQMPGIAFPAQAPVPAPAAADEEEEEEEETPAVPAVIGGGMAPKPMFPGQPVGMQAPMQRPAMAGGQQGGMMPARPMVPSQPAVGQMTSASQPMMPGQQPGRQMIPANQPMMPGGQPGGMMPARPMMPAQQPVRQMVPAQQMNMPVAR